MTLLTQQRKHEHGECTRSVRLFTYKTGMFKMSSPFYYSDLKVANAEAYKKHMLKISIMMMG